MSSANLEAEIESYKSKQHSNKVWPWQYAIKAGMMAYKTRSELESLHKPVGWPWSGAVLFLNLWTMYKFGWCDVVACETRHGRGSGGIPARKFLKFQYASGDLCDPKGSVQHVVYYACTCAKVFNCTVLCIHGIQLKASAHAHSIFNMQALAGAI